MSEAKGIRIGYVIEDELAPVTEETKRAVIAAVGVLREQGFDVREYRPKHIEAARKLWDIFFVQCGAMFYAPEIAGRRGDLSAVFLDFLARAEMRSALTAEGLLRAWAEMDLVRGAMLREMEEFPVLLTPVCSVPAFQHGERSWAIGGMEVDYLDAMRYTQWFNLLGAPAAVVPVSVSASGLPIGVQIAGRPFEDEVVMTIARAIESAFGYRVPPYAAG